MSLDSRLTETMDERAGRCQPQIEGSSSVASPWSVTADCVEIDYYESYGRTTTLVGNRTLFFEEDVLSLVNPENRENNAKTMTSSLLFLGSKQTQIWRKSYRIKSYSYQATSQVVSNNRMKQ